MATVTIQLRTGKKGKRSYGLYYKDPLSGNRKYYKTFRRFKDARQAENKLRNLIDNGELAEVRKSQSKMRLMRYGEVAESLKTKWKNGKKLVSKTLEDYLYWLDVTIVIFGNRLLCEMIQDDLSDYQTEIAISSSNVTANRHLFVIKQVFKEGMALKAIFEDEAAKVSYLSEEEHERIRFIYPDGLRDLLEASRKVKRAKHLPPLICLAAEHGASRQEALDLDLDEDIDFDFMEDGMIHFYRTKTKKHRTEFLMPQSKREVQTYLAHQDLMRKRKKISSNGSRLVFSHLNGTPILRFDNAWRRACQLAGIENLHFHDLRHTFCSNAILVGATLKDVKEMIGHKDLSMTDRYSHIAPARQCSLQKALAEHYWSRKSSGEDIGKMEREIGRFQQKRRKS